MLVWNWTPEAEKDAKEAFDKAFELGYPFYDTGTKKKNRGYTILFMLISLSS